MSIWCHLPLKCIKYVSSLHFYPLWTEINKAQITKLFLFKEILKSFGLIKTITFYLATDTV